MNVNTGISTSMAAVDTDVTFRRRRRQDLAKMKHELDLTQGKLALAQKQKSDRLRGRQSGASEHHGGAQIRKK